MFEMIFVALVVIAVLAGLAIKAREAEPTLAECLLPQYELDYLRSTTEEGWPWLSTAVMDKWMTESDAWNGNMHVITLFALLILEAEND